MMTNSEAWESPYEPRDRRFMDEWALDHVKLSPPFSIEGPFDVSSSRHFIAPMRALQNPRVRQVNFLAPPRGGKTLICDAWSMHTVCENPGNFLWSFQNDEAAWDQAFQRTAVLIENCEKAKRKLKHIAGAGRTQEINFVDMILKIVGPADSNFQSRGWQNVALDEVWMYPRGKVEEARGRLGDFVKLGTDKFFLLSQGGEVESDWDIEFQKGLIFDWLVECQKCGHFMIPKYRAFRPDGSRWGFVFDQIKNDRGLFIESRVVETVRFECEKCGHPHTWSSMLKNEWNRTGKYVAEVNSEKRVERESYRCNSLIDYPHKELCALYIFALNALKVGNPMPLIQFLQKQGAEMASERSVLEGAGMQMARVEITNTDWEFADERLCAVDVQEDHYWVEFRDFSKRLGGESRRVWFGKCYSWEEIESKREHFKVTPERVFVDSGDKPKGPGRVYAACAKYGWTAVKGVGTVTAERKAEFWHSLKGLKIQKSYAPLGAGDPESGISNQGSRFCRLIRFSSDDMADMLDGLIANDLYKEPMVDESDPLEVERKKHFTAEYKKKKVDKFTGRESWVRVCPSGNNHSYDLGKMLILGAILCEVIPDPHDRLPS